MVGFKHALLDEWGTKSPRKKSKIVWKDFPEEWILLSLQRIDQLHMYFAVAQIVEHGASKRQDHGFDSQGKQELIKCLNFNAMEVALDKSVC